MTGSNLVFALSLGALKKSQDKIDTSSFFVGFGTATAIISLLAVVIYVIVAKREGRMHYVIRLTIVIQSFYLVQTFPVLTLGQKEMILTGPLGRTVWN